MELAVVYAILSPVNAGLPIEKFKRLMSLSQEENTWRD